ncbi:mitochondrial tRNA-specific 2-thiouridylase 1 isoform X2 [Procambarus clarkii]|uniref:mitochondrial tRNA-specific 2-thiouridylase 1 isoform X2 n=1 Tax=Procambarus clarkii TaxID=6728 RepID=UPI0037442E0F
MGGITRFSRVVLGMSGGVDSAVSALLLKRKGYEVIGVFMRNWDEKDEKGQCTGDVDAEDAEWVCRRLDIPFREVNFVKEYWNDVFMYMIEEYKAGFTPNPDIMCNKKIKFSPFLQYAKDNFNSEVIATGHYARTSYDDDLKNYDPKKGDYNKDVVRKIAESANLDRVAKKRDSTGICFIGSRNFQEFISQYIEDKPGNFIDLDSREVVGTHRGIHQWTVGQRCNIGPFPQPYFVAEKHPEANNIYVVAGTNHPALFTSIVFTEPIYWIHSPPSHLFTMGQLECHFRFQNTSPLVSCVLTPHTRNPWHHSPTQNMVVSLAHPLRAVTPGQYAVFYLGDECIGSARILRPGPSLYALNINDCRTFILKERERQSSHSYIDKNRGRNVKKQESTED